MLYKLTSAVFLLTSVIFAGLYFSSKETNLDFQSKLASIQSTDKTQAFNTPVIDTKFTDTTSSQTPTGVKVTTPKVIYKEVSSHPDLDIKDIDMLVSIHNNSLSQQKRRLRYTHPLLFERLNIGEDTKLELSNLMAKRNLIQGIQQDKSLSEEERQELSLEKHEMVSQVNEQIYELLGDEAQTYQRYETKRRQYQQIAELKDKMINAGEFDIPVQDKLAGFMYDNYKVHEDTYGNFWENMRGSDEKSNEFLTSLANQYEQMKEDASFLSPSQQNVLASFLNNAYKRYERGMERFKNRRNSDGSRRSRGRN